MNAKDFQPSRLTQMCDLTPIQTSWQWIVNFIKSDALKNNTDIYRQRLAQLETTTDAAERKALKDQLTEIKRRTGGFFPHAVMRGGRTEAYVVEVSNHIMVDIDKIAADKIGHVGQLLRECPYVMLLYTTYSGRGLRAVVRVEGNYSPKQFRRVRTAVNDYVEQLCGVEVDRQCGDITRFSGLAHDADVYYNPEAKLLDLAGSEKCGASSGECVAGSDYIGERVKRMVENRGCYYEKGNHNNYISRCMYLMNKFGVAESEAMDWALREFSDYKASSVRSTVRSCYRHVNEHGTYRIKNLELRVKNCPPTADYELKNDELKSRKNNSKFNNSKSAKPTTQNSKFKTQNSPKVSPAEIRTFLSSAADFRLNVISGQTEVKWKDSDWTPIEDRDVATLWMRMAEHDMATTPQTIRDVIDSDFTPKFNPFTDYFDNLPQWDGNGDPIKDLADRVKLVGETPEERHRLRHCLRRWLVAMVAAIMEPQTINHEILVFLGKQGNYKSTFFSLLLPPQLQRYFYTRLTVMSKDKDDLLTLSQYALIAYEEIDCLSPTALNHLKAEVTMRTVNERQVYRHFKECRQHIASFCATGNNVNFLTDSTGNRRWLAFEVESIDSPLAHPFDYTAIYSQVWALYKQGEKYWFDGEEIDQINARNEHFSAPCLEEELISLYYCQPGKLLEAKLVSTAEILERINMGLKVPLSAKKIGMAMKRLGYDVTHTRNGNKYRVHERTTQEIEDAKRAEISIADQEKAKPADVQTELPF